MKKTFLLISAILMNLHSLAQTTVELSTSESDTKIFANGNLIGNGKAKILVFYDQCVNVKFEKEGFVSIEKNYCKGKNYPTLSSRDMVKLEQDQSYYASVLNDLANTDIELKSDKSDIDTWKTISQIIMSYFDVIEITDRETGYLRTAWVGQSFNGGIIRTRVIVKMGSSNPLVYKVKLVSEFSTNPKATLKNDELFREWGRVSRKFENLIPELQSRISKK